jgi:site-specific DNA-cytosine methylase
LQRPYLELPPRVFFAGLFAIALARIFCALGRDLGARPAVVPAKMLFDPKWTKRPLPKSVRLYSICLASDRVRPVREGTERMSSKDSQKKQRPSRSHGSKSGLPAKANRTAEKVVSPGPTLFDKWNPTSTANDSVSDLLHRSLTADTEELPDCPWSEAVALDPKHRPQVPDQPSGTVRREWCRYPQEAHLLELTSWRYRRLTPDEVSIIQGFEPAWFHVPGISIRNRMRATGDAVPPPLARAIMRAIDSRWSWNQKTALEICSGCGGLASGASSLTGFEHLALVEYWEYACEILRHEKPWSPAHVFHSDVREFNFRPYRDKVGLLSGGPPCQPWSLAGRHLGASDPRDLLGSIHEVVDAVRPEAFVFENVPGLAGDQNRAYLMGVLQRLRKPSRGLNYGVVAGILNAADYGVPQLRRRLFIIGFRDRPSSFAYSVFDTIQRSATHRDPTIPDRKRRPWVTLAEAFRGMPEAIGWRKWISVEATSPVAAKQRKRGTAKT